MRYNETMVIFVLLLSGIIVLLAATRPATLGISDFELNRRRISSNLTKIDDLREESAATIVVLLRILQAIILVVLVLVSVNVLDWLGGVIASIVVVLTYQPIANLKPVRSFAAKLYTYYEKHLLALCQQFPKLAAHLANLESASQARSEVRVYSKEEFVALIKRSSGVLSKHEVRLVGSVLDFENKTVSDIMTPRSMIDSVKQDDLLGPILLSELHETGHSRFPVIDKDIDHIVGVLYVRELLSVDSTKNSPKVAQVMDKEVCFIRQDQSLDKALAAFIKTEKLLFVVINEFRETVGLLSLEDVIEALLGQKINDEFEKHSDLRAVAEHNPKKNNSPAKSHEV